MKTAPGFDGFRRASVADQAAVALRNVVREATWGTSLPGEHEIARRLGIGRYSVRAALSRLADEGLLELGKGRRPRLRRRRRGRRAGARPVVCLVAPDIFSSVDLRENPMLIELHAQLVEYGIAWEEVYDRNLAAKSPDARLKRLVSGRQGVLWVLLSSTPAIQAWFQAARVPSLILGSAHPGISLNSIDLDYRAVGWHAAGRLAQHGHRHMAIILPNQMRAGDVDCYRGFAEYLRQKDPSLGVIEIIEGHDPPVLQERLARTMRGPRPPTGIFSVTARNSLTALCHLHRMGFKIPGDVSLISSDNHTLLDISLPELTRYRLTQIQHARRNAQAIRTMLAGLPLPAKARLITPSFVPGSTLGRAPGAPI